MKIINDGGPAFPCMGPSTAETVGFSIPGMSLRDYLAVHAPPITDSETEHLRAMEHHRMLSDKSCMYQERCLPALDAERRYKFADAMLQARNQ